MRRGEIWWASLPRPRGSGPGKRRPVLVVQSDTFNQSAIRTVVVAVITSNLALADAPGNVHLPRKSSRLPKSSVVNVSQLVTVDRQYLTGCVGALPTRTFTRVKEGMRLVLDL